MLFIKRLLLVTGTLSLCIFIIGCASHKPQSIKATSEVVHKPDTATRRQLEENNYAFYIETGGPVATDAYRYPFVGPNLWALNKDQQPGIDKRLAACQIPEDILNKMSTIGVVKSALCHPMNLDNMASNEIEKWFEGFSAKANVYQELFKRPDAGTVLLERVKAINLGDIQKYDDKAIEGGYYLTTVERTYFLIAQPQILNKLDKSQRLALMLDIREKLNDIKTKYKGIYPADDGNIQFATVKLMQLEHYPPFMNEFNANECLRYYVNSFGAGGACSSTPACCGYTRNPDAMDKLSSITNDFIASKKM